MTPLSIFILGVLVGVIGTVVASTIYCFCFIRYIEGEDVA